VAPLLKKGNKILLDAQTPMMSQVIQTNKYIS